MPDEPAGGANGNSAALHDDGTSSRHGTDDPDGGMTVASALRTAERLLSAAGIDGARLEATLLLGHVLGHSRAQLLAALSDPLGVESGSRFDELLARRAKREPLQYLRGRAPFLDFELEVRPGVLIPRPETEGLVERALDLWDPNHGSWAVDVGTGSGAIAIGLAIGQQEGRILAVDKSPVALDLAARNAARLDLRHRVAFVRGDFLRALDLSPDDIGIIVSNPPYVADGDEVDPEVRDHEPRDAWNSGPTGLEAYERIIPEASALLRRGRWLLLEIGYGQEQSVAALFEAVAWEATEVRPDFRGIPRVVAARKARDG